MYFFIKKDKSKGGISSDTKRRGYEKTPMGGYYKGRASRIRIGYRTTTLAPVLSSEEIPPEPHRDIFGPPPPATRTKPRQNHPSMTLHQFNDLVKHTDGLAY